MELEAPTERRTARIAGITAGLIAGVLYLATNDPHVGPGDFGELQTMAHTGGIAHAGYPTLVLLLRLFALLPFGSLAWRANLLSCVSGAVVAGMAAWLIARATRRPIAGVVTALGLACSHVLWKEAVHAGVHAFTLALDVVMFALALAYEARPRMSLAIAIGLLFGLALTSHLTVLSLAPVLLWVLVRAARARTLLPEHFAAATVALVVGLLPFMYLLFADRPDQPMNYIEDVMRLEPGEFFHSRAEMPYSALGRIAWLLSGRQYLGQHGHLGLVDIVQRMRHLAGTLVLNDAHGLALPLALAGAVMLARRRDRYATVLALWLAGALFMTVIGARFEIVPVFFLPGLFVLMQAAGVALAGIEARSRAAFAIIAVLVIAAPILRLAEPSPPGPLARFAEARVAWTEFPAPWTPWKRDPTWEAYGLGVLGALPPQATVLTRWRECTVLRYVRWGVGYRRDVNVLPVGGGLRVANALVLVSQQGIPAFATWPIDSADRFGWRSTPVRVWAAGGLWQLEPPVTGTSGH